MKRNFIWTLGIVSVLSFVSCGSDSPDKTLQKYLNFEKVVIIHRLMNFCQKVIKTLNP